MNKTEMEFLKNRKLPNLDQLKEKRRKERDAFYEALRIERSMYDYKSITIIRLFGVVVFIHRRK